MNRQVHLVAYPDGVPRPGDFALVEAPEPAVDEGEVLVAVSHLGMDPFPRLRMRADARVGPPLPLDAVVDGRGVGHVIETRDARFAAGDLVAGDLGWQERAVCRGDALTPLDAELGPAEHHLNVLGPSGLTAFFTMHDVAPPRAGQTVMIAPAAGSVGIIAGQIAVLAGARVVGTVADDAQASALADVGFAATVRHDDADTLAGVVPGGVDVFVDGVGGDLHDRVLRHLNLHARVVLLGFISGYNSDAPPAYGNVVPLLFKRATATGFLLADHAARFDDARRQLAAWVATGALRPVQTLWQGLDQAPAAFCALFGAAAPGKQIIAVQQIVAIQGNQP